MIPLPKDSIPTGVAIAVGTFLSVVLVAFLAGRCSAPSSTPVPVLGIDAGPGEVLIAERLDAEVRREDERISELEAAHREELEELEAREVVEYVQARSRGRGALAAWLKERSRALLDGGVR